MPKTCPNGHEVRSLAVTHGQDFSSVDDSQLLNPAFGVMQNIGESTFPEADGIGELTTTLAGTSHVGDA